jgi:hypothetical protein
LMRTVAQIYVSSTAHRLALRHGPTASGGHRPF